MYQREADTHTTGVLALALAAAQSGQAVFPVRGKAPAISKRDGGRGYRDASRDRARITAMFNRARSAGDVTGYGIACGASGLAVLDWDGPEGLAELKRRGMPPTLIVKTARGGHACYRTPPDVEIKSRDVAPHLELKASGAYVVGPGSLHPSGTTYAVARDLPIADAPAWITDPEQVSEPTPGASSAASTSSTGPVSIDTAGPAIPAGGRNRALARIAGRLHDGTRDLEGLTRDLEAINGARCTPPLEPAEVRKIAASIHRYEPCSPGPKASERVRAMVAYLRGLQRPVRGRRGASGWAIYHALLALCEKVGGEHPAQLGVVVRVDRRTWALEAAVNNATVTRWLHETPLVAVLERGKGRRASTLLVKAPKGCYLHHSTSRGDSQKNPCGRSDADNTLFRDLYRTRWSEPEVRPKRGLVTGTRKVRQGITPGREGIARMGKSRAALLDLVRRHPGASRQELAAYKGVKPGSLSHPLRWLIEAGLIVRVSRGCYAAADGLEGRVAAVRTAAKEPQADRQQIRNHRLERARHRYRTAGEAHTTPEASKAAYQRSRERGEAERARVAADPPAPTPEPLWERVRQLEREGMSYRHAVWEVFGPESAEHREALAESRQRRADARGAASEGRARPEGAA